MNLTLGPRIIYFMSQSVSVRLALVNSEFSVPAIHDVDQNLFPSLSLTIMFCVVQVLSILRGYDVKDAGRV